jgi:hypothetical protein
LEDDLRTIGYETFDYAQLISSPCNTPRAFVNVPKIAFKVRDLARSDAGQANGGKVIIIAHSMGGIVARAYIEDNIPETPYANDVSDLYTLGSPHAGVNIGSNALATLFLGGVMTLGGFVSSQQVMEDFKWNGDSPKPYLRASYRNPDVKYHLVAGIRPFDQTETLANVTGILGGNIVNDGLVPEVSAHALLGPNVEYSTFQTAHGVEFGAPEYFTLDRDTRHYLLESLREKAVSLTHHADLAQTFTNFSRHGPSKYQYQVSSVASVSSNPLASNSLLPSAISTPVWGVQPNISGTPVSQVLSARWQPRCDTHDFVTAMKEYLHANNNEGHIGEALGVYAEDCQGTTVTPPNLAEEAVKQGFQVNFNSWPVQDADVVAYSGSLRAGITDKGTQVIGEIPGAHAAVIGNTAYLFQPITATNKITLTNQLGSTLSTIRAGSSGANELTYSLKNGKNFELGIGERPQLSVVARFNSPPIRSEPPRFVRPIPRPTATAVP